MKAAKLALRTRMRLYVGLRRAEELLQAVDRELLHFVHHLTAAIVPLARVPLGVLVGERGAHGVDDGAAREVLARDELESALLPAQFPIDQARNDRDRHPGVGHCGQAFGSGSCSIFAMRRAWRPPSKGV
jgi:hypothetical protein